MRMTIESHIVSSHFSQSPKAANLAAFSFHAIAQPDLTGEGIDIRHRINSSHFPLDSVPICAIINL